MYWLLLWLRRWGKPGSAPTPPRYPTSLVLDSAGYFLLLDDPLMTTIAVNPPPILLTVGTQPLALTGTIVDANDSPIDWTAFSSVVRRVRDLDGNLIAETPVTTSAGGRFSCEWDPADTVAVGQFTLKLVGIYQGSGNHSDAFPSAGYPVVVAP